MELAIRHTPIKRGQSRVMPDSKQMLTAKHNLLRFFIR